MAYVEENVPCKQIFETFVNNACPIITLTCHTFLMIKAIIA
jgi:hypothetical protein